MFKSRVATRFWDCCSWDQIKCSVITEFLNQLKPGINESISQEFLCAFR